MKIEETSNNTRHRIAVLNFKDSERNLLSKALSCVSGYTLLKGMTLYEWERLFHIDEKQLEKFSNQFLIASSSIIEQIQAESENAHFISTGAAFSGVLAAESMFESKSIELTRGEKDLLKNLLDLAGKYSADCYDWVIHVQNADSRYFDELSVRFYNKYQISCMIYDNGNDVKDILEDVIGKLEISPVCSPERAIAEAERTVNLKNW